MTGRIFKSKLGDGGGGSRPGHTSHRKKQGLYFAPRSPSPGMPDLSTPIIGHNENRMEVVTEGWGSVALEPVF